MNATVGMNVGISNIATIINSKVSHLAGSISLLVLFAAMTANAIAAVDRAVFALVSFILTANDRENAFLLFYDAVTAKQIDF